MDKREVLRRLDREAPEVDSVHAAGGVYCRECKFSEERSYKYIFCKAVDRHPVRWCRYDDFCSRGVKREVEEDK